LATQGPPSVAAATAWAPPDARTRGPATPPRSSALLFTAQEGRVHPGVGGVFDLARIFLSEVGRARGGVPTLALTGTWSLPPFVMLRRARTAGAGRDEVSWEPWAVAPGHQHRVHGLQQGESPAGPRRQCISFFRPRASFEVMPVPCSPGRGSCAAAVACCLRCALCRAVRHHFSLCVWVCVCFPTLCVSSHPFQ
jgi:hypothetical protein